MAVVSKTEIILPWGEKFIQKIKYFDPSKKSYNLRYQEPYFSVELPEVMKAWAGEKEPYGKTAKEAEKDFKKMLEEYTNASKDVKKVIVIKFDLVLNKPKGDSRFSYNNETDGETKIAFNWGVYLRTQVGAKVDFKKHQTGGHNVLSSWERNSLEDRANNKDGFKIIEWSEARQIWCEQLEKAFLQMGNNIENFMVQNSPEDFEKLIDGKKFVLLQLKN